MDILSTEVKMCSTEDMGYPILCYISLSSFPQYKVNTANTYKNYTSENTLREIPHSCSNNGGDEKGEASSQAYYH